MSRAVKVLGILNGKGGVGKTTTAVNLAAVWAETHRVLLVDADPQGSATWWTERNEAGMGFDVAQETKPQLLKRLKKVEDYELVVVDTPPSLNSKALAAAIAAADYLVLPTLPAPMDLTALVQTVKTAVHPAGTAYRVLLTRVDPRSISVAIEAQNTLKGLDIPACDTVVRAYKAHERAALEGVAITQRKGGKAHSAESDYRDVAHELQQDWRI